jgi:hypothetical protein
VSLLFGKRRNDTAFLQGTMDEIMIFDRALSAVEIRSIFDARSDGMCGQGVGGSVTGMLPNRITCRNMTTGQAVTAKMGSTTWDCNQLGLVVRPGDRIRLTVTGQAEDP